MHLLVELHLRTLPSKNLKQAQPVGRGKEKCGPAGCDDSCVCRGGEGGGTGCSTGGRPSTSKYLHSTPTPCNE